MQFLICGKGINLVNRRLRAWGFSHYSFIIQLHKPVAAFLNRSTKPYPFIVSSLLLAVWMSMEQGWRNLLTVNKGPLPLATLCWISLLYQSSPFSPESLYQWRPRRRKSQNRRQHRQNPQSLSAPRPRNLTQHQ